MEVQNNQSNIKWRCQSFHPKPTSKGFDFCPGPSAEELLYRQEECALPPRKRVLEKNKWETWLQENWEDCKVRAKKIIKINRKKSLFSVLIKLCYFFFFFLRAIIRINLKTLSICSELFLKLMVFGLHLSLSVFNLLFIMTCYLFSNLYLSWYCWTLEKFKIVENEIVLFDRKEKVKIWTIIFISEVMVQPRVPWTMH